MLKLFVDTEFSGFKDPELISIGVVASSGEEFYAEVEYELEACSDFVQSTVIPLLTQDKKFSMGELRVHLLSWIEAVRTSGPI